MRFHARRRSLEDEEESSFVSMTDLTVSFLFIVLILLAFFAYQLKSSGSVSQADYDKVVEQSKEYQALSEKLQKEISDLREFITHLHLQLGEKDLQIKAKEREIADLRQQIERLKQDPLKDYLRDVTEQRNALLGKLRRQLNYDFPDLKVEVSKEMDALRFKGDGLFPVNSSMLTSDKRTIVEGIADRLHRLLPCYTLGPQSNWSESCNPVGAVIEAVQIEGHTDSDGSENSNLTLSTERANATFFAMTDRQGELKEFRNTLGQPVLSVAGYGKMRPVKDNSTTEGKASNRRIDLRIIMYTPGSLEDIEKVKSELRRNVQGGSPP